MRSTAAALALAAAIGTTNAFAPATSATRHVGPCRPLLSTRRLQSVTKCASRAARVALASQAVDADAEYTKQQLAQKQAAYEAKRRADATQSARQNRDAAAAVQPLSQLPMIPYLNDEGLVNDVGATRGVRASVYAVFDAAGALQYIGVSRSVQQSLRLHLARCPDLTHGIKVQHISTPSRSLLEVIKDEWVAETGGVQPPGNDGGAEQARWEAPMDVRPVMTDKDRADLDTARTRGREDSAMKSIARRFEAEKVAIMEARGVQENMRFDPKLKGQGLLDLWQPGPDTSVPPSQPAA